jgi:hypothetical protein
MSAQPHANASAAAAASFMSASVYEYMHFARPHNLKLEQITQNLLRFAASSDSE